MKIAVLTQYYKPEIGAPQNRLYEMVTGLKEKGNEVVVVTGMPNYPTGKIFRDYRGKISCTERTDGIEIKRYWLYASNTNKIVPRIWNMLSFSVSSLFSLFFLRKKKIDCLIVESPPLTLGVVGYLLSKLIGAKLILNVSDLWPLSAKELGAISDGFIYKFLEKTENFLYKHSTVCLGQSSEIVQYMNEHGAKKTYLFRNGVDPTRFNMRNIDNKDKIDCCKIVYTGLLGYAQGIYDICSNINFKSLNAEFHIYGAGGERDEIELFLKNNPDRGIYYHGSVGREEIPTVLAQYNLTLIPLVKNIFGAVPSKIYESMAAGLPILFSGEGEGKNIITENNIGWVCNAKDYEGIARIIANIEYDIDQICIKRNNCINCANTKFNRPEQIKQLDTFLKLQIH